jgi:DNA-binding response OmpR family regulator
MLRRFASATAEEERESRHPSVSTPSEPHRTVIGIGASTGGPAAIRELLAALPAPFPIPLLLTIHIAEPFGAPFAVWLDGQAGHRVRLATDGEPLFMPEAALRVAPPNRHLLIAGGRLRLSGAPERNSCRPSIDTLFESMAQELGAAGRRLHHRAGRSDQHRLWHAARGGAARRREPRLAAPRHRSGPGGPGVAAMIPRALVVDDSATVRADLAHLLERGGIATECCTSIDEARRALAAARFDLVILDVLLPDGDGVALLGEIRDAAETRNNTVMLLSTEAEVRDRIRGLTTGADEYIGKPYDAGHVLARARELMKRGQRLAAPDRDTILVIDDSLTFREHMKEVLERAGFAVLLADCGEEGLRLAGSARPAAIVIDGVLPDIDGATVIRRIRLDAALRRTPCLMLTASDEPGAEIRALDSGADAFLRKDADAAVTVARLKAALRSAETQQDDGTASIAAPKKLLAAVGAEAHRRALAANLLSAGFDVAAARSGEEALDLLAVRPVDGILLDLDLPGLGAIETCRRIKAAPGLRDIPVMMLAAREDDRATVAALAAGADDCIARTDDFSVLRARLAAQLRRKQFEDENRGHRERLLQKELEAAEARAAQHLAEARAAAVEALEAKNRALEAFSYSVAHDLRAPLRAVAGFGRILEEDHAAALDGAARDHVRRIRTAAARMTELIDDLLQLAQIGRAPIRLVPVDLSALAHSVAAELARAEPERRVQVAIAPDLAAAGDAQLLRIALANLLGNAWKYSRLVAAPRIEVGAGTHDGGIVYYVRDNGAGFDMRFAHKLFMPFERLHAAAQFPGTGIGLATVQRIVARHGGKIWAESAVGAGATFFWTLGKQGDESAV